MGFEGMDNLLTVDVIVTVDPVGTIDVSVTVNADVGLGSTQLQAASMPFLFLYMLRYIAHDELAVGSTWRLNFCV